MPGAAAARDGSPASAAASRHASHWPPDWPIAIRGCPPQPSRAPTDAGRLVPSGHPLSPITSVCVGHSFGPSLPAASSSSSGQRGRAQSVLRACAVCAPRRAPPPASPPHPAADGRARGLRPRSAFCPWPARLAYCSTSSPTALSSPAPSRLHPPTRTVQCRTRFCATKPSHPTPPSSSCLLECLCRLARCGLLTFARSCVSVGGLVSWKQTVSTRCHVFVSGSLQILT